MISRNLLLEQSHSPKLISFFWFSDRNGNHKEPKCDTNLEFAPKTIFFEAPKTCKGQQMILAKLVWNKNFIGKPVLSKNFIGKPISSKIFIGGQNWGKTSHFCLFFVFSKIFGFSMPDQKFLVGQKYLVSQWSRYAENPWGLERAMCTMLQRVACGRS